MIWTDGLGASRHRTSDSEGRTNATLGDDDVAPPLRRERMHWMTKQYSLAGWVFALIVVAAFFFGLAMGSASQ